MSRDRSDPISAYLYTRGIKKERPSEIVLRGLIADAHVDTGWSREGVAYRMSALKTAAMDANMVQRKMEQTADMITAANEEVKESRAILTQMANEVAALGGIILPKLLEQARALRDARLSAVFEVKEALGALRDIRAFFLEKEYETEMARMERLIKICREIQSLKKEGVFDAICDSALKLAVGDGR